jgi:hypothetical protein
MSSKCLTTIWSLVPQYKKMATKFIKTFLWGPWQGFEALNFYHHVVYITKLIRVAMAILCIGLMLALTKLYQTFVTFTHSVRYVLLYYF